MQYGLVGWIPCAFNFIKKDRWVIEQKTGKKKRKSNRTKNEMFRDMLVQCYHNFRFDLCCL